MKAADHVMSVGHMTALNYIRPVIMLPSQAFVLFISVTMEAVTGYSRSLQNPIFKNC